MRRLAVLSLHTSPLAQPGTGDGGGMNVYVRELTAALARSGRRVRRLHPGLVPRPSRGGRSRAGAPGPSRARRPPGPPAQGDAARRGRAFTQGVLERMTAPGSLGPSRRREHPLRLGPRQLLALGALGPRHQARARPAPGLHLPHPRPGQGRVHARGGRGRHAAPPGRGRGVHHRLLRCRAGVLHRRGRADRLALRRRSRPHPHRPARRRPRLLRPGPPPPGPSGPRAPPRRAVCCSSSAGSSRSSVPTWPSRRWPSCASRARSPTAWWSWAARAAPTARSRFVACSTWPMPAACATGCTSSHPSPTSSCPPTTGRPTCASCPAARSRSASSPSRPPPAGPRWWPRPSAG